MQLRTVLLVFALTACAAKPKPTIPPPQVDMDVPTFSSTPQMFANCDEIKDWLNVKTDNWTRESTKYWQWQSQNSGGGPVPVPAMPMAVPVIGRYYPHEDASNLEAGAADEPDVTKLLGTWLFLARSHSVLVLSTVDWQVKQTLDFPTLSGIHLLTTSDKLIVFGTNWTTSTFDTSILKFDGGSFTSFATYSFPGSILTARIHGDQLLMINMTSDWIGEALPTFTDTYGGVACGKIQKSPVQDLNIATTTIRRIDTTSTDEVHALSVVNAANQIYIQGPHIYLINHSFQWFFWDTRFTPDQSYANQVALKFDWLTNTEPTYLASGLVPGETVGRTTFGESASGNVFYAAAQTQESPLSWSAHLLAFRQSAYDLGLSDTSENFGIGQNVRTTRIFGNRVFVTSTGSPNTELLTTIDLSDERHPHVKSGLAGSGNGDYTFLTDTHTLFSIGLSTNPYSYTQGLRLSLFNIDADPTLSQQYVTNDSNAGTSVSSDPHALYYDPALKIAAMPVVGLDSPSNFNGAIVLNLNSGLTPIAKLSHSEWVPVRCQEVQSYTSYGDPGFNIQRIIAVGGDLVSLSIFGLKVHDPARNYAATTSLAFSDDELECARKLGY